MTRKHFEAIANILTEWAATNNPNWYSYKYLAEDFANYLQTQNALFNKAKFLRACNISHFIPHYEPPKS